MTKAWGRILAAACGVALALGAARVHAEDAPTPSPVTRQQANEAEQRDAELAAKVARIFGPAKVPLKDEGELDLPQGFAFLPQPQAGRLVRAYGNTVSPTMVGLVLPAGDHGDWWSTLDFVKAGYVKDDDAKNWNADELLAGLKESMKAQNDARASRGFPAMEVTGWIEPPAYDARTHRLVWSALVRRIGETGEAGAVNYNTYALGRDGYFSLDLIAGKAAIEADKPIARTLLAAISYDKGKAYDDFDAASDRVAEYGLAALVGGVALKKLGLLALGAAFAVKFVKVIGLAVIAAAAAARRLFTRRKPPAPR
jgi:uncharacterized membrane-anchored protein